ncbi:MAG: tRNA (adenine-N1)-methyltransferase [Candidatus Bathyarchaeia archaeon]|nr:tRNA (adenine-N1)-methyltransferase [Candidatus Bathyarchaeota archaeon]
MDEARGAVIRDGDPILLYYDRRRKWLVKASEREFHTHKGIVNLGSSIGRMYGEYVESSLGYKFYLLKPTIHDLITGPERPTQIIYPKDIGLILLKLDVAPGRRILEIGTGSGALTMALANLVRPDGHVYSYELRSEFASIALKKLRNAGLNHYATIRVGDAAEVLQDRDFDAAIMDIGEPWRVIPKLYEVLRPSSPLASFSPTFNQVERTVKELARFGFIDISTMETMVRELKVEEGATRPSSRMIGHTGYLTFARKTI